MLLLFHISMKEKPFNAACVCSVEEDLLLFILLDDARTHSSQEGKVQGSFLLYFPPSQQAPSPAQSLSLPAASLKISHETLLPTKLRQLQEKISV